jgi:hypothetical protein
MRSLRLVLLLAIAAPVSGCVVPAAISIASIAVDGIAIAVTGKGSTDHAISTLAQRDCRMWRLLKGESMCAPKATVVTVARLPPQPLHAASPAERPPEPKTAAAEPKQTPTTIDAQPAAPALAALSPTVPHEAEAPAATPAAKPAAAAPQPNAPTRHVPTAAAPTAPPLLTPAPTPEPKAAGGRVIRGEMVIRSGTSEAEARTLADDLKSAGATVRPVRHVDVILYEVVMGLSG